MTIVHIITALGIGGAEKLLVKAVNRLVKNHNVHIIYFKEINDLASELNTKVTVKRIPISFITIERIANYCQEIEADVIHTHLGHADILGLLASKNSKAKIFCTLHNIHFKKNFLDELFFKVYRHLFLKTVPQSKIIAISQSVKNHASQKLKVPRERLLLLPNAIEQSETVGVKKTTEKVNILYVGRLEKQKSLDTLLKAMQHLKTMNFQLEFYLTIIGDGSKKKSLVNLSRKLQVNDVVNFKGKQASLDQFYNESHIFVLPSIWEGFGLVILEAFRSRTAVIASDIEGPAELIENNKNGLLFEPKNAYELAQKIKLLIEDPELREMIAETGFQSFTKEYHINNYVEKLENFYVNA